MISLVTKIDYNHKIYILDEFPKSIQNLREKACEKYKAIKKKGIKNYRFFYRDDENDKIIIDTDSDLQILREMSSAKASVKIYVIEKELYDDYDPNKTNTTFSQFQLSNPMDDSMFNDKPEKDDRLIISKENNQSTDSNKQEVPPAKCGESNKNVSLSGSEQFQHNVLEAGSYPSDAKQKQSNNFEAKEDRELIKDSTNEQKQPNLASQPMIKNSLKVVSELDESDLTLKPMPLKEPKMSSEPQNFITECAKSKQYDDIIDNSLVNPQNAELREKSAEIQQSNVVNNDCQEIIQNESIATSFNKATFNLIKTSDTGVPSEQEKLENQNTEANLENPLSVVQEQEWYEDFKPEDLKLQSLNVEESKNNNNGPRGNNVQEADEGDTIKIQKQSVKKSKPNDNNALPRVLEFDENPDATINCKFLKIKNKILPNPNSSGAELVAAKQRSALTTILQEHVKGKMDEIASKVADILYEGNSESDYESDSQSEGESNDSGDEKNKLNQNQIDEGKKNEGSKSDEPIKSEVKKEVLDEVKKEFGPEEQIDKKVIENQMPSMPNENDILKVSGYKLVIRNFVKRVPEVIIKSTPYIYLQFIVENVGDNIGPDNSRLIQSDSQFSTNNPTIPSIKPKDISTVVVALKNPKENGNYTLIFYIEIFDASSKKWIRGSEGVEVSFEINQIADDLLSNYSQIDIEKAKMIQEVLGGDIKQYLESIKNNPSKTINDLIIFLTNGSEIN